MDPDGSGYVEQAEFEKYLVKYGINLDQERAAYLFTVIQSLNAEMREKGESSHHGTVISRLEPNWFRQRVHTLQAWELGYRICVGGWWY